MNKREIQENWKKTFHEITGNERDKKRSNYLHFDEKPILGKTFHKIFNPDYIAKHSFLPFLSYDSETEKIKNLSEYLAKHNKQLPANLRGKENLPQDIQNFIESDQNVSKVLISRKNNSHKYATLKKRPIRYASHFDTLIFSYYSELLNYDYEKILAKKNLDQNVLAFRKSQTKEKKCNIDHSYKAFCDIQNYGKCVVLAFDVSSFFDLLDHAILKDKWLEVVQQSSEVQKLPIDHFKVFKSISSYSHVERDKIYELMQISSNKPKRISLDVIKGIKNNTLAIERHPVKKINSNGKVHRTRLCSPSAFRAFVDNKQLKVKKNREKKGIPQGSPMSGILSNIYMIDFDVKVKEFTEARNGKYYRYCDDLLCIIPLNEEHDVLSIANEVESFVFQVAKDFKLIVNEDKTDKYVFMPSQEIDSLFSEQLQAKQKKSSSEILCVKIKKENVIYSKLQYLGFKFDGRNITIRSSSIARYQRKMKRGINYHLRLKKKHAYFGTLKTQKLRVLYSHIGQNNFPAYVYRAARAMKSASLRRQISKHQKEINHQITIISSRIGVVP